MLHQCPCGGPVRCNGLFDSAQQVAVSGSSRSIDRLLSLWGSVRSSNREDLPAESPSLVSRKLLLTTPAIGTPAGSPRRPEFRQSQQRAPEARRQSLQSQSSQRKSLTLNGGSQRPFLNRNELQEEAVQPIDRDRLTATPFKVIFSKIAWN